MDAADNKRRRLQIVDDHHDEAEAAVTPDGELTVRPAAGFAALVAHANQSAVERMLEEMNVEQLRTLVIALARQVNATENANGEVADVGRDGVCSIAIATAAQAFGTTRDAVLSADRHRAVTDARAVAMTAARHGGLTLPAIASYFGKNHTSVMYAQNKVANNPRLNAVRPHRRPAQRSLCGANQRPWGAGACGGGQAKHNASVRGTRPVPQRDRPSPPRRGQPAGRDLDRPRQIGPWPGGLIMKSALPVRLRTPRGPRRVRRGLRPAPRRGEWGVGAPGGCRDAEEIDERQAGYFDKPTPRTRLGRELGGSGSGSDETGAIC